MSTDKMSIYEDKMSKMQFCICMCVYSSVHPSSSTDGRTDGRTDVAFIFSQPPPTKFTLPIRAPALTQRFSALSRQLVSRKLPAQKLILRATGDTRARGGVGAQTVTKQQLELDEEEEEGEGGRPRIAQQQQNKQQAEQSTYSDQGLEADHSSLMRAHSFPPPSPPLLLVLSSLISPSPPHPVLSLIGRSLFYFLVKTFGQQQQQQQQQQQFFPFGLIHWALGGGMGWPGP
uniref:Uncharacterized protein n=1 Tax=Globodera rostochiensis TaxID=31243 RepID=A0A914ICE3_GLORO